MWRQDEPGVINGSNPFSLTNYCIIVWYRREKINWAHCTQQLFMVTPNKDYRTVSNFYFLGQGVDFQI